MKKSLSRVLCLLLISSILFGALAGCGGGKSGSASGGSSSSSSSSGGSSSSGEKIELSFSHHDTTTSVWHAYFTEWANNIMAESNCEITIYPGATLAATGDGLNALRTGVCDILWTNMAFFAGQFPVTEGVILPMIGNGANGEQFTNALWDLWEDEEVGPALRNDWSEFKMCILHASPTFPLGLKEPGSSPADLAGRTVRAPAGGLTGLMTAAGLNPVLTPPGDIYTSMDKGIIEGYMLDYSGIPGFALEEVTDYMLDISAMNQFMCVIMYQETFDALPDDVKAAIDKYAVRETALKLARNCDEFAAECKGNFEEKGTLIPLSDEDLAAWEAAGKVVQDQWVADTASIHDSQKFLDRLIEYIEKYTA